MEFSIILYEKENGNSPVEEFLNDLKRSDQGDFAAVMAGLAKLRNRQYHRPPLSKPLGDALFELRHVGKLNTRMLYFFMKGRKIIVAHGIRNKGQAVPLKDKEIAVKRMNDWLARQK